MGNTVKFYAEDEEIFATDSFDINNVAKINSIVVKGTVYNIINVAYDLDENVTKIFVRNYIIR
jgi:hypothetical protein